MNGSDDAQPRVCFHRTVPHLTTRRKVWLQKAAQLGCVMGMWLPGVKSAKSDPQIIVVAGPSCQSDGDLVRMAHKSRVVVVADTWITESIGRGELAPVDAHVIHLDAAAAGMPYA